jgi:hypothetical protein
MNKKILYSLIFFTLLLCQLILGESIPVIKVNEGELVKLKLLTVDEDGDPLTYIFTAPLNENGEWQTTYGDEGEYTSTVTVSDGNTNSSKEFKIVVLKSNRPPVIQPIDDTVITEGDIIELKPNITDEENDKVGYVISKPFDSKGVWQTDYTSAGDYAITITATDGKNTVNSTFNLIVTNKNRDPVVVAYAPNEEKIFVKENENIDFSVSASDEDKEELGYAWYVDGEEAAKSEKFVYHTDYDSAGSHEIKAEVSDEETVLSRIWAVEVENVNRAPGLEDLPDITINENEKVVLEFNASDPDGDAVVYIISEPIGNDKEWQTTYDDAGMYDIEVTVSDSSLNAKKPFKLIVNDVDRAPLFKKIDDLALNEEESLEFSLSAVDEDGDKIEYIAEGMPDGAVLEGNAFKYTPSYDVVKKPGDWINNVLNFLHPLENWIYPGSKIFYVTFTAAGKEKSTFQTVKITVNNVNRQPVLDPLSDVYVNESQTAKVYATSYDPDNDRLTFSATEPLSNSLKWFTGYASAGEYLSNVTVSDGELSDSKQVSIVVENVNRQPVFGKIKQPVKANEDKTAEVSFRLSDPDNDQMILYIENSLEGVWLENNTLKFKPGFDTASKDKVKEVYINLVAEDGSSTVKQSVLFKVKNVNRAPVLLDAAPLSKKVTAHLNEPVIFSVTAEDPDNDTLSYKWSFGFMNSVTTSKSAVKRTFKELGQKDISVTVSDGDLKKTITWHMNAVKR